MTQRLSEYFSFLSAAVVLILLSACACWIIQLPLPNFEFFSGRNRVFIYIPFLDRYLESHPSNSKATLARAEAYECLGYDQLALDDYNRVLAISSDRSQIIQRRGHLLCKVGDYRNALSDFNYLIQNSKEGLPGNLAYRSYIYSKLKEFGKANTDAERAVRLQPGLVFAYISRAYARLGLDDDASALADCHTAQTLSPNPGIWAVCLAHVLIKEKNWTATIDACNKLLAEYPYNVDSRWLRAAAYNGLGNYKKALEEATRAICRNPATPEAYVVRAQANYHLNRIDDALYDAKQAVDLDPSLAKSDELHFAASVNNKFRSPR